MTPELQSIKDAFFAAKIAAYIQPPVARISDEIHGAMVISFPCGEFCVTDTWVTSFTSDVVDGWTIISFHRNPVWCMHYHGYYDAPVIPFLRECLYKAYSEHKFFGGRGPELVCNGIPLPGRGTISYLNTSEGDFERFSGREEIICPGKTDGGYHLYSGGSLLRKA